MISLITFLLGLFLGYLLWYKKVVRIPPLQEHWTEKNFDFGQDNKKDIGE